MGNCLQLLVAARRTWRRVVAHLNRSPTHPKWVPLEPTNEAVSNNSKALPLPSKLITYIWTGLDCLEVVGCLYSCTSPPIRKSWIMTTLVFFCNRFTYLGDRKKPSCLALCIVHQKSFPMHHPRPETDHGKTLWHGVEVGHFLSGDFFETSRIN